MHVRLPPPASSGIVPSLLAGWLLVLSAGLAQAQADNQPHGLTATVSGRRVTLSWLAPIRDIGTPTFALDSTVDEKKCRGRQSG